MSDTQHVKVRLAPETIEALDILTEALGATNRAETVRWLLRNRVDDPELHAGIHAGRAIVRSGEGKPTKMVTIDLPERLLAAVTRAAEPGEPVSVAVRRLVLDNESTVEAIHRVVRQPT